MKLKSILIALIAVCVSAATLTFAPTPTYAYTSKTCVATFVEPVFHQHAILDGKQVLITNWIVTAQVDQSKVLRSFVYKLTPGTKDPDSPPLFSLCKEEPFTTNPVTGQPEPADTAKIIGGDANYHGRLIGYSNYAAAMSVDIMNLVNSSNDLTTPERITDVVDKIAANRPAPSATIPDVLIIEGAQGPWWYVIPTDEDID